MVEGGKGGGRGLGWREVRVVGFAKGAGGGGGWCDGGCERK